MKSFRMSLLVVTSMFFVSHVFAMKYARVVKGYPHLIGRVVVVKGTVEQVLRIDTKRIYDSLISTDNSAIDLYLKQNPLEQTPLEQNPLEQNALKEKLLEQNALKEKLLRPGTVYCGYDSDTLYLFHESWLQAISREEAQRAIENQEGIIIWMSPDGTLFSSSESPDASSSSGDEKDPLPLSIMN